MLSIVFVVLLFLIFGYKIAFNYLVARIVYTMTKEGHIKLGGLFFTIYYLIFNHSIIIKLFGFGIKGIIVTILIIGSYYAAGCLMAKIMSFFSKSDSKLLYDFWGFILSLTSVGLCSLIASLLLTVFLSLFTIVI